MPGDDRLGTSFLHGDCHLLEEGAQLSLPSENMEPGEAGSPGGGPSLSGRLGHHFLLEMSSWWSQIWGPLRVSSNIQTPWACVRHQVGRLG